MLAVAFRFPAGRYHATPWGRNVNEAEVEWPPAPWRIVRALIATWHRKAAPACYPEERLDRLVERVAGAKPIYALPPAIRAHSRHYMPVGDKRSLIFDAFVRLDPDRDLIAAWPDVDAPDDERDLLSALLRDLGFLGRAESWVDARLLDGWDGTPDCWPSELEVDITTGEALDPVRLIAPLSVSVYAERRAETVVTHGLDAKRLKKAQQRILTTLPERLIDALRVDTGQLQQAGWSCPPGAHFLTYQRPMDCFAPGRGRRRKRRRNADIDEGPPTARLALAGKPLPLIERALRIGELVRKAAMHNAERVGDGVPPVLSGHDMASGNRHGHAFYLPEDADGDGRIDHILVHASAGLDRHSLAALDAIERIWEPDGGEWAVLFESAGCGNAIDSAYTRAGTVWRSATPYLCPWHCKKGFGIAEQIARECRLRSWLKPEVAFTEDCRIEVGRGRRRRPVQFDRFRERRGLRQPDRQGHALVLRFPEPIRGPIALGFGCHFGLGMFR